MMIHVKHASITGRAVMAPLRLKYIAHQAISSSLVFVITEMEAPKNRNLARIGGHGLKERPHQHKEEYIVEN
jgi:hypothetical protein